MSIATKTEATPRKAPVRPVVKTYQNMEDGLAPGEELLAD